MLGRLGRKAFGGNLSDEKDSREARDELLEGTLLAEVTTGTKARRWEQSQRCRDGQKQHLLAEDEETLE